MLNVRKRKGGIMKAHRFVVLIYLGVACLTGFALSKADGARQVDEAAFESPVDRMLKDVSAAISTLDVQKAEALFLPPDNTADGKNRQNHILEMKKDWKEAKERGQKMTVDFRNTVTIVRTEMFAVEEETEAEPITVELKVTFTKDGCKIVSMKYVEKK